MKKFSLLALLCCLLFFVAACPQGPVIAKLGKPAPDFSLVDRNGKTWTLSELKGQVVFINFWATWCPPCREEMPSMQKLYAMMPKDTFKMLAILNKDDPALADIFIEKLGMTIPVLDDQINGVGPKYGLTGIPETFIIDKQGVIREKIVGGAQWDTPDMIKMVQKYIDQ